MAIPKDKVRITITIHKETLDLIKELQGIHCNAPKGNIVESVLYVYAQLTTEALNKPQEEEKENKKDA